MIVESGRLSSKGQIVIPKRMRDEMKLEEGDDLVMVQRGELLLIRKLTLQDIIRETDLQHEAGETLTLEEAFEDLI